MDRQANRKLQIPKQKPRNRASGFSNLRKRKLKAQQKELIRIVETKR